MNQFRRKIFAWTAAAAAIATTVPMAMTQEIRLDYESFDKESEQADRYWRDLSDTFPERGLLETEIFVAKFGEGEDSKTVTMLLSSMACGMQDCPIRVFDSHDRLIAAYNVCQNIEMHSMNPRGNLLLACDSILPVPGRLIPGYGPDATEEDDSPAWEAR